MDASQSVELVVRLRDSDGEAAQLVFDRYADRLAGLAYRNLSQRMRQRIDPEDVVQSVYRSFFRKAEEGRFTIERAGDLWRLLAAITVAKVKGQVEYHTAQKRDFAKELSPDPTKTCVILPEAIESEPSSQEVVALGEELELALQELDATGRQIIELAMQNHDVEYITQQVTRSARTVRRTLQQFRENLESRLIANSRHAS